MKYKLRKLSNGLRLITSVVPSLESATLTVWVKTGSRNENPKEAGISHFLEHMVFKGGKKRTSAKEISEAVDAIGGEFNAGTSKEWTNFYIKARSANLNVAYDVLSDMVLTPALRQNDIDREKGVIIEEIGMYEDTPMIKIEDIFENVIYKSHPLGRDIIGSKATVSALTTKKFQDYRNLYYHPQNIVITVAGGIDEAEILTLTKKYFGGLKHVKTNNNQPKFVSRQKKPQVLLSTKTKDQAHFILGFLSSDLGSEDRFAESVLATILAGGMSSRLFTEIREKRGLAYAVRGSRDAYIDTGAISVYAGVNPKKVEEAIKLTLSECYKIASNKNDISNPELAKAKEYLKGHIALSLEDTRQINQFFGLRMLLLDDVELPEEIFKKIDKVTVAEVVRVAKKNFKPEKLNLAIIGPYKDTKRFEKLLK